MTTQTERLTDELIGAFTRFEKSTVGDQKAEDRLITAFDAWLKDPRIIEAADVKYDREKSEGIRKVLIQLRDNALMANKFEWAVALSHAVAWMAVVMDERWPKK